jgi:hypothetical protein
LIVSFNSQDLRDLCASLEQAEAKIGSAHAQELLTVLSDAEAADTAAEFLELYSPNASADRDSISVLIGVRYRVTFVAIGTALGRERETRLDWRIVRRLKMMDLSLC